MLVGLRQPLAYAFEYPKKACMLEMAQIGAALLPQRVPGGSQVLRDPKLPAL